MDLGEGAKDTKQFDAVYPRGGKAIFTIEGLNGDVTIDVIDERRTIIAEDGKFTDEFAPFSLT